MSTYQATYDAVRSRLGNCDIGSAVRDSIDQQFGNVGSQLTDAIQAILVEHMRPSVLYRPSLMLILGQWVASFEECEARGDSPDEAMRAFDREWFRSVKEHGEC